MTDGNVARCERARGARIGHARATRLRFRIGNARKLRAEDDEPRDVPAQVLREPVVEDAEPGQHLAEQPAVQAVRNSHRRAPALRPAAVVEAQVDHLHERVQPRQHADAAQLLHERSAARGATRRACERRRRRDRGRATAPSRMARTRVSRSGDSQRCRSSIGVGRRAELRDRWNHKTPPRGMPRAPIDCARKRPVPQYKSRARAVPSIWRSGTTMMSRSRITKSAYFPGVSEPSQLLLETRRRPARWSST